MNASYLFRHAIRSHTLYIRKRLFSEAQPAFIEPYKGAGYSEPRAGKVFERIGDRLTVQDSFSGRMIECRQRKGLDIHNIVAGDNVFFQTVSSGEMEHIVVGYNERRNLIFRSDPKQPRKIKYIASNIDQLLIVVAVEPPVSLLSVDRLLVAAEFHNMKSYIVVNKFDIDDSPSYFNSLRFYENIGYPLLRSCVDLSEYDSIGGDGTETATHSTPLENTSNAHVAIGMKEIRRVLGGKTSMLIGQSGVGKSSITNALIPSLSLPVGCLTKGGLGAHVTSTATFHRVQGDSSWTESTDPAPDSSTAGMIVDSPGLREFGLAHMSAEAVQRSFPEISTAAMDCKYRNCRHSEGQIGCAVVRGVQDGSIAPSRYKSYTYIIEGCSESSGVAGAGGRSDNGDRRLQRGKSKKINTK